MTKSKDIEDDPQAEPEGDSFENVAKSMNCSTTLLKRLDKISDFIHPMVKSKSKINRNFGWRYFGRYYYKEENGAEKAKKNNSAICPLFWLGIFFNRPAGYQFYIAFPKKANKNVSRIQSRLEEHNYNYYAEYTKILGAYWYYVYLDNLFLSSCCSNTDSVQGEIKKIVDEVLG